MPVKADLHIETATRSGHTYLKRAYHTQPFKVMNVTEGKGAPLHLMVMNASPGILDGDEHRIRIDIAEGSELHLHTQSYQRLFAMKQKAVQYTEVYMAAGSLFCYLPHPVVPHRGAVFSAVNTFRLSGGCTLLWGEVVTCGRKGCGEAFQYSSFSNRSEVFLDGKLVVREVLLLQPGLMEVQALGQLEGYTHQGTLLFLGEGTPVGERIDALRELLNQQSGILAGVSALPVSGLVVRILGNKGEHLYGLLNELAALLGPQPVDTTHLKKPCYAH